MPFNIFNAPLQVLSNPSFQQKKITLSVLRLDKIHPEVSGNKLFKLHYFLQAAMESSCKTIITFGGAFSNHLVATAYACKANDLQCVGIVRGEKPTQLSATLQNCINYGMQLRFISREMYAKKETKHFLADIEKQFEGCIIIPEGGYHPLGAKGATTIYNLIEKNNFTHICTAAGTATTLAGLLLNVQEQQIITVPVLKGFTDIMERLQFLGEGYCKTNKLTVFNEYHFGGYAKKTPDLLHFMNILWQQHQLPTDFVYTAKLFYAIFDKINNNYFDPNSNILCLHTGGLQGNTSLPANTLLF
jgi:1-aminocyclopropane-1-carboxylate deaminase